MGKGRTEASSGGVFSIAITLLILEFKVRYLSSGDLKNEKDEIWDIVCACR